MLWELILTGATTAWASGATVSNIRLRRRKPAPPPACPKAHLYEMHPPPQRHGWYWPSRLTTGDRGEVRPVFGPGEKRWAEAYQNKMDALHRED